MTSLEHDPQQQVPAVGPGRSTVSDSWLPVLREFVLELAQSGPLTAVAVAELLTIDLADARLVLGGLVEDGALERREQARQTRYRLREPAKAELDADAVQALLGVDAYDAHALLTGLVDDGLLQRRDAAHNTSYGIVRPV